MWLGTVDAGPLGDHYIWALAKGVVIFDCGNVNVQQENEMKAAMENEQMWLALQGTDLSGVKGACDVRSLGSRN